MKIFSNNFKKIKNLKFLNLGYSEISGIETIKVLCENLSNLPDLISLDIECIYN